MQPGIRDYLYIGGVTWVRNPGDVSPRWLVAKASERARDATLYTDYLQPETGWPVVTAKLELSLSWDALCATDIRTVNGILSKDAALSVCPWVEIAESFWLASGEAFAGYLKRRNSLTTVSPLPANAATNYAVSAIKSSDGSAVTVTLGTPDATTGITPWTASGTSAGEYVTIRYTPVYYMVAEDGQQSFRQHQQGQTLVLVEV